MVDLLASVRPAEIHTHTAIKVGVRLRPLVSHERRQQPCLVINGSDVSVIPGSLSDGHGREGPWRFDHAMDSSNISSPGHVDNYAVYKTLGRGIVEHALKGFNACLFCYGQTGTGKTATIFGNKHAGPGFLILLLKDLFEAKSREESQGNTVKIAFQMLEIYNEKVFDLLHDTQTKIELHVLPESVQIKGAEVKLVETVDECLLLIDQGNHRKHTAATAANPHSSRGHIIIKLVIQRAQNDEGIHLNSEIYLADLAGHENEKTTKVTGDRLVELSFINKSLMWLESALHALASRHHHPVHHPARHIVSHKHEMALFRNSKLTLILSQALLGNSLAHVIVTLSPAAEHFSVSLSSLRFANEVKRIIVDAHSSAHRNPQTQIKNLEAEVKQLKEKLATANSGLSAVLEAEVKQLREQLAPPSAALQAEVKDLKEKLVKANSASAAPEAEVKMVKLEAEVKHLKEQLEIARAATPAALEAEVRQLREQLGISTPGFSVANSGSASISHLNGNVGSGRVPSTYRDFEGFGSGESAWQQEDDVLLPWSHLISQLTKMPPEVFLEKLHSYKAENEKVCQQLDALVVPRAHSKQRAPSPVPVVASAYTGGWNVGSVSTYAEGSVTPSSPLRLGSPTRMTGTASVYAAGSESPQSPLSPLSPMRTGYPQRVPTEPPSPYGVGPGSATPSSPLRSLRSASPQQMTTYGAGPGSATPSSPLRGLRTGSPGQRVSRSPNTYLSTPSRATLGVRRVAGPVSPPDATAGSPMRMRSSLGAHHKLASSGVADAADVGPIRMRSAQNKVSSPGVADATDVGPMRMRSVASPLPSPPGSTQSIVAIPGVADVNEGSPMRMRSAASPLPSPPGSAQKIVAIPSVGDANDLSPMRMRSAQNMAANPFLPDARDGSPMGPMMVRSAVAVQNPAVSQFLPDASDGSPTRMRSALSAQSQEAVVMRRVCM